MSTQFGFLNTLRREKRLVVVYLLGGTRLQGRISSFDQQGLLLETKTGMVLCSQDQISTVGPDVPRSMLRPRGPRVSTPAARVEHAVAQGVEVGRDEITPRKPLIDVLETARPLTHGRTESTSPGAPVVTQKARRKIILPEERESRESRETSGV